jgi:predicted nucleotidyltransferase
MVTAAGEFLTDITNLLDRLTSLCKEGYGDRLVSLVVFGSVGRGTARPDSDIDLLLVIKDLPNGRIARVTEFMPMEIALRNAIKTRIELSPVFKTPEEILNGSPLLLDMVEDSRLLFDREDFFQHAMKHLDERLRRLGARRIWRGNAWYWDLKPDYRQGEIFEI